MAYGIPAGQATTLTQNVVYGLPSKLCYVQSSLAVESSVDGTTWAALTGANTVGVACAGSWIRCTTGAPVVIVKLYG